MDCSIKSFQVFFNLSLFFFLVSLSSFAQLNEYDEVLINEEFKDTIFEVKEVFGTYSVVIEGAIKKGDSKAFEKLLAKVAPHVSNVYLYSPGGNVSEAIKIGKLVRSHFLNTYSQSYVYENKLVCTPKPKSENNCRCDSSCFLVWIAGVNRFGKRLGVHRAFIQRSELEKLSLNEASKYHKAIKKQIEEYFEEMDVNKSLVHKVFDVKSDEMYYLEGKKLNDIAPNVPQSIQEYVTAKCQRERAYHDKMIALNDKKLKGKATPEELSLLKKDYQFYLKLSECEQNVFDLERKKLSKKK